MYTIRVSAINPGGGRSIGIAKTIQELELLEKGADLWPGEEFAYYMQEYGDADIPREWAMKYLTRPNSRDTM